MRKTEGIQLGRILAGLHHEPVVYFLKVESQVKIGTSQHLAARCRTLGRSIQDVAMVVPGGHLVESAFHQRWAEYKVTGEWFEVRGSLANFLGLTRLGWRLSERRKPSPLPVIKAAREEPMAPLPPTQSGEVPISLREANASGLVAVTLANLRNCRARDATFPTPIHKHGQIDLYDPADLVRWEQARYHRKTA